MAVRRPPAPSGLLYRIGRNPDPLAWPDWRYVGGGRFDDAFDCWAIFEGASIVPVPPPEPIVESDPNLQAAMTLLGLTKTRP